jgi:hypothetical protein
MKSAHRQGAKETSLRTGCSECEAHPCSSLADAREYKAGDSSSCVTASPEAQNIGASP